MELNFPFDPVERAEKVERLVMKDGKRLYYRFRAAPYYGGIATADAIGCSFHLFRITGSEPLLGEASLEHLLGVLKVIFQEKPQSVFILETNGFFLGCRKDFIKKLIFKNLWIRISLKGVDEDSFELISGARREFFRYPLVALRELEKEGMKAWPAVMRDLFSDDEIGRLEKVLGEYGIGARLEEEGLEEYPFVIENMKKRKVRIKGL